MKKLLIKWFGEKWYCRQFHSQIGHGEVWTCDECGFTHKIYENKI